MIRNAVLKEMTDQKMKPGQLAKLSKVSRQQLAPWLAGKTKLNEINILKIMDVLSLKITKEY